MSGLNWFWKAGFPALLLAIAVALWAFGVIPWWGILIALPVVALAVVGIALFVGVLIWMADGSH